MEPEPEGPSEGSVVGSMSVHSRENSQDDASDSGSEHLYNTDHESDGELEAIQRGVARPPLVQKVEKLMTDLRQRQERFKRRRDNLAQSVSRGIRKEFLQQQERIVLRSKQMAKKLQSGRSRAWRHKWVFALVEADFVVTAFWLGKSPQTFYVYFTAQMAVVLLVKIFDYRFTAQHYFLLDFCFFSNACTLTWLWLCPTSGWLFNAVEAFCGVLAISVPLFRNSCVPHDFARISNAYVHYPQLLLVLSVLWSCEGDLCVGVEAGYSERWSSRIFHAWSTYMTWAVVYASVIFVFAKNRIERKRRSTLYNYFAHELGFTNMLPGWLRGYSAVLFMMGHQTLFLTGLWFIFVPFPVQVVATLLAIIVFFHNGGRFYVDHFWKAHARNTVLYLDAANNIMTQAKDTGSHSSLESRNTDDSPH
ncbi:unnamed protein product [Effrenium voratum]|nr:unnamed protein product [Effrenium voratum]